MAVLSVLKASIINIIIIIMLVMIIIFVMMIIIPIEHIIFMININQNIDCTDRCGHHQPAADPDGWTGFQLVQIARGRVPLTSQLGGDVGLGWPCIICVM